MEIEIAEHGRMTESGSSLLRLIQNNNIPLLDLLVRESVQNSLDAAKEKAKSVKVDFVTGKFDASALNAHFDRITQKLDKKYPSAYGEYDFIQIRDSDTNGLTGPVSYNDVENNQFGNLLKLVYEICKPQQNEGAGGSWGLGKTVYFRMGTGLVIYYSRINQDGRNTERMAACMVEDETKSNAILPSKGKLKRGIAWWGKATEKNHTVPLEDSQEIKEILDIFGIKPYTGSETGTTIIIPYIDPERLLSDVYALNEEDTDRPYWTRRISDYINVAIQRWYAPRIRNSSYTYGPYLAPSVNGHKILADNMLPLFKAIREMYNITEDNKGDNGFTEEGYTVTCEQISLRNVFGNGSVAGRLVCVKLDKTYLKMLPPDNCKSPYQHVSNTVVTMDTGNSPLIMYTRRPGMIVGYDYSGAWTHSMTKCSPDEFIIGLFTLNSSNQLRSDSASDKPISLEEYIRQGEKADHAAWTDHNVKGNNPRIVYNIQKNIIKKINQTYKEKIIDTSERKNIGLSHALADMLLPSRDFGKKPSAPSGSSSVGYGGSSASRKSSFTLAGAPVYKNGVLSYTYEMVVRNTTCILESEVITDFAKYSADKWEEETGMPFPLEFDDFSIDTIRDKTGNESQHSVSLTGSLCDTDCSVEAIKSKTNSILNAVNIRCTSSAMTISGKMSFHADSQYFKVAFSIKE